MACLPSPKWKNGYCSRFCSGGPTSCSPDAACVDFFGDQLCLKVCGSAADCRGAGYACETLPGSDQTVCRARCATSADCRPGQECDQQTGRCK
jgi:hypothetical protein